MTWTDDEVLAISAKLMDVARRNAVSEECMPTLLLFVTHPCMGKRVEVIPLTGDLSREDASAGIRDMVRRSGAEYAITIVEMRLALVPMDRDQGEIMRMYSAGLLSEHPDCYEAVVMDIESRCGRHIMVQSVIHGEVPERTVDEPEQVVVRVNHGPLDGLFDDVRFESLMSGFGESPD